MTDRQDITGPWAGHLRWQLKSDLKLRLLRCFQVILRCLKGASKVRNQLGRCAYILIILFESMKKLYHNITQHPNPALTQWNIKKGVSGDLRGKEVWGILWQIAASGVPDAGRHRYWWEPETKPFLNQSSAGLTLFLHISTTWHLHPSVFMQVMWRVFFNLACILLRQTVWGQTIMNQMLRLKVWT